MPDPDASSSASKPLVISLCGTFLKPEMQSIYRQVTGFQRVRTAVYTQSLENESLFPFSPVTVLEKQTRPRDRGNFVLRFWYKYVLRVWPPPRPINRPAKEPHYGYDMVDHLRNDQPTLVHVYYGHKAVHYLEMLEAWGGPFIVSFHGVDVSKFFDREGYAERMHRVFAKASLVLARSESLLEKVKQLGCPPEKLRLNRTPIPLDHLTAFAREAPEDGNWRLVQACRLIPKKGILTTLRALTKVKQEFPNFRYLLCGSGPMENEIRQKAAELGLGDNVELLGWMSQEALLTEFNKAQLFLHPSETTRQEDQEGIPNSMLEAMATGLPVVATQHGGIPEAVTSGQDGLLVGERQPDALAEALLTIMRDETLLRRLSIRAAESVRESFGAREQVRALEDCYFEAMQK